MYFTIYNHRCICIVASTPRKPIAGLYDSTHKVKSACFGKQDSHWRRVLNALNIHHHTRCVNRALEKESQQDNVVETEEDLVEIGIVGPAHGVRGEFKVQPLTDSPKFRLGLSGARWLRPPPAKVGNASNKQAKKVELVQGKQSIYKGREVWIVKLKGINSPEEVKNIRGHILLISASEREVLEDEDEYYVQELIGLKVEMLESGDEIGTVIDVLDGTGTYDVLRIEHFQIDVEGNARKSLLPFAKEIVPVVDLEQKVLRITPPEGMFDQPVSSPKKDGKKSSRRRETKPMEVQTEE
eukprot:jgi/Picsp_1/2095/NSC_05560-R1_protein